MKGRQSRYVTGGESFAEIARLPSGAVVRLCLNTGLEDALREASKSLKSAFTRSGRKCRLSAGTAQGPFTGRRQGVATHLFVSVPEGAGGKKSKNVFARLPGGEGK